MFKISITQLQSLQKQLKQSNAYLNSTAYNGVYLRATPKGKKLFDANTKMLQQLEEDYDLSKFK